MSGSLQTPEASEETKKSDAPAHVRTDARQGDDEVKNDGLAPNVTPSTSKQKGHASSAALSSVRRNLLGDLQEGCTISLTVQGTQTDPSSLETAREELIRTLGDATDEQIDDLIRELETVKANRARQLAIENCLAQAGGVYVWHVAGLNVKFVDLPKVHTTHMADFKSTHRALLTDDLVTKALSFLSLPGGWQAALVCKAYRTCWQRRYLGEEELCVVKVGMTMDQSIDSRLKQELTDTTQWRVNPRLHMTAEGLKDGRKDEAIYVGHLVACFPGRSWSGWEKIIKRCLGLPFGE